MISPALQDASTDQRLKGAPIQLLVYLHGRLDPGEYRPLKLWPVAQALRMEKATVGRAMRRLVECGYIRQGKRERNAPRSYLLLTSRGVPCKSTPVATT